MSYSSPSDEVAQDFAIALEGLNLNNRYEISNLTVIAKENTEHAYAISEALKNHIKQTSPQKKLPAFYVLDSIVKNVGTPYTLFFGRQLYATFMEAYALMDHSTRRKMDEMLKTWKEPVPGSIDRRPVFPPDTTSPIETALIRARTSALEAFQRNQPQMGRGRAMGSAPPYRETPTPPGVVRPQVNAPPGYNSNYVQPQYPPPQPYAPPQQYGTSQPPPNSQHYPHPQQYPGPINGQQQDYGAPQRPPSQQYTQQPANQSYYSDDGGIEVLKNDIANLITSSKADFAQNYWDTSIQTRLKALLDLQTILLSQRLPPDQIALIKEQVAQLSIAAQQPHKIQNPPVHVPPPAPVAAAPPPVQQPSLESLLGPGALAALLARKPATPQNTPYSQPAPSIRSPPQLPPTATSSTPVPDTSSLLASLRAAGILGNIVPTSTPPISLGSLASRLPPGFPPPPPMLNTPPSSRTPLAEIPNDVELKANSLKIPRPHLIYSLYQKLGEPCNQCGRRFKTDEEGKKKKVAHLDWHFRVNQGMVEAAARGQHRDWYIDELAWIKWREIEEDQVQNSENIANGTGGTSAIATKPKIQYLPVPDDPANSVCPICQEKFSDTWLHDAQEFVWIDAKKVGDRYFHASCYAEATKDSSRINRGTPEPVLGKRKAEDEHITLRSKIKTEPLV